MSGERPDPAGADGVKRPGADFPGRKERLSGRRPERDRRERLAKTADRFEKVATNPDYEKIASVHGFQTLRRGLREYVLPPADRQAHVLSARLPIMIGGLDRHRTGAGLNFRLMSYGWLTVALGWCLLGLSLWLTLRAIPTTTDRPVTLDDWPLVTACVALAMVAGFLSLLPGGIGVREYVVMELLVVEFGAGAAAVSAILLRLVWLLAELLLAGVLYAAKPAPDNGASPTES